MIIALSVALTLALVSIANDPHLRDALGDNYWVVSFALIGCILLVLSGYVWDRGLVEKVHDISQKARAIDPESEMDCIEHPDEIIGLARRIEQMARSLQKVEASYRGIVEDQADLICRYRADGGLIFVNTAYADFFGRRRTDFLGQPLALLSVGQSPLKLGTAWPDTLTFECTLENHLGRSLIYQWTHQAIKDREGAILEYQAVGHDITRRKEFEEALRKAKEAAESADRAKSEFLAIVSHEIRTPINGVVGFARLLGESPLSADQMSYVETIQRCGLALETLVSDILDLSKIEAGHLEVTHEDFTLADCIEDVLNLHQPEAATIGVRLSVSVAPGLPEILNGDPNRIRQILNNLVGNALKFTEKGEVRIEFTFEYTKDPSSLPALAIPQLCLIGTVADTGIGIPNDQLDKLFRPFSQLDSSMKRRYGGTGLGLVISKRLCELMGGRISVRSEVGKGSTFTFRVLLGLSPHHLPEPMAAAER